MAKKKRETNTVEAVRKLAEPIAESLGLELWDVRFEKEGGNWFLRLFIDKEDGVGIEDCEKMSRAIDAPLDELDPIDQSYCMEVSSPGIERELTREKHFEMYKGSYVRVKLIRPDEFGNRIYEGELVSYIDGDITIANEEGDTKTFNKKETVSVNAIEDYMEE